ncbi:MAG: RDD family protein, partial [Mycobacteriaceae bacterium]|nr:RDD family protein [Mycobacteriaceae bacterium]
MVQVDQLVDLGARQAAATFDQILQPRPGRLVRQHVGVEVHTPRFDDALTAAILIIFTVGVIVGYPVVLETATRGRSLGKVVMGLRVVSEDGSPERFRQALFRALAGFVEIWMFFGGPAVISSLLSARGKRIGDVFAGTLVVSERGPKLLGPPAMPPYLQRWAAAVELSGLRRTQ